MMKMSPKIWNRTDVTELKVIFPINENMSKNNTLHEIGNDIKTAVRDRFLGFNAARVPAVGCIAYFCKVFPAESVL